MINAHILRQRSNRSEVSFLLQQLQTIGFLCISHLFLLWVVKTEATASVCDFDRAIAVGFNGVSMALCSLWHDDSSWRTATWGEKLRVQCNTFKTFL